MSKTLPPWAHDIPRLPEDVRHESERAVNLAWREQIEKKAAERAEWMRVLSPGPQPHHNTQVRDLGSFTERQRQRMKRAGWWPFKQRGETLPDYLLAIAIGIVLAALLFFGLSS